MPRVVGIDAGTVSVDICGLIDGRLSLDGESLRTGDAAKITKKGFLRVYRYPADRNDSPPPPRD